MDDPDPLRPLQGAADYERRRPSRTNLAFAALLVLVATAGVVLSRGGGGSDARIEESTREALLAFEAGASPAGTQTAELSVQTGPDGVAVLLDGELVGAAPAWEGKVQDGARWVQVLDPDGEVLLDTLVWLSAGARAEVSAETPESASEAVRAAAESPPSPEAETEPARTTGTLQVSSTPADAAVQIDGRRAGTTPLTLDDLSPGEYTVTLTRRGYEPVQRKVEVRRGGVYEASVDLRRIAAPPAPPRAAQPAETPRRADPVALGTVEVLVRPWGRITIDGVVHMTEADVVYRTELPVGVHRIEAAHPALGSRTRTVTVSADQPVRVEIDLVRSN